MREGLTKAALFYQCQSCQELHERAPHGVCPICGSDATVPLGWYQVSEAERLDWLERIYGGNKKKGQVSRSVPVITD